MEHKKCPWCHGTGAGHALSGCGMCGGVGTLPIPDAGDAGTPAVPAVSAGAPAVGIPSGIRTRVAAVRGQNPGPLNDGDRRHRGVRS